MFRSVSLRSHRDLEAAARSFASGDRWEVNMCVDYQVPQAMNDQYLDSLADVLETAKSVSSVHFSENIFTSDNATRAKLERLGDAR